MSLHLVTGPANSAKAGALLDVFRARVADGPGAVLVVPTAADAAAYGRELGPVVGGLVTTFAGLLRAAGAGESIGPVARERLVAAAAGRARLRELAASAAAPGFAGAAGALIEELQRALVGPDRLDGELAAIYRRYLELLDELGVDDRARAEWRALEGLDWGGRPVVVYGFDDFTALERDTLLAIARTADVWVSLNFEPGRRAFAARTGTVEKLRAAAAEVTELPASPDHYEPAAAPVLHHLERSLFEPVADGVPDPPGDEIAARRGEDDGPPVVRLLEGGGERAEIELVAAEVLRLREAGVSGEEIAVVFADLDRHAALVSEVFRAYGVEHALHRQRPFAHLPVGRGLLALLAAAGPDGTADDLVAYLRTPGVLEDPAAADELERDARRHGQATTAEARTAWETAHEPLEELDRVAAGLAAPAHESPGLPGVVAAELRRLLAAPWRRQAHRFDADELDDARAAAAALDALDQLAALPADLRPAPAELARTLAELPVTLGAPERDGAVVVTSPLAIRARRFRAVVVCGLQEGELPRRPSPDPFLSDAERAGLGLAARDAREAEERYLLYAACSRPTGWLRLSYRSGDEEGNPAARSPFLDDLEAALGRALVTERARRPLANVTWPLQDAPTAAEAARSEAARGPRRAQEPIGPLRDPGVLAPLADEPFSANQLELFATCPVRWMIERRLSPDGLAPDPEPLIRGGLLHDALEQALGRLREETGSARVTPETVARARELAVGALERGAQAAPLDPHAPTAVAVLQRARRDLERYLEWEATCGSDWEPRHLELAFGFDDEDGGPPTPPLILGDGEVRLRGRIDRIEVDPGGEWGAVRDYKSSKGYPRAKWEDEDRLQGALYLLAVRRLLGLKPAAALYQPLRGKDLRARGAFACDPGAPSLPAGSVQKADGMSEDELEEVLAWAEQRACELAGELRAGDLEPRPERCDWKGGGCSYPGICRSTGA